MNCERCKKNKVDFLFSKDSSICKKCVSELEKAIPKRKTKYQLRKLNKTITPEKYLELLKLHNECCHLCLKPYKREKLVLKYSFFNGEPIGVFCPRCLTAI